MIRGPLTVEQIDTVWPHIQDDMKRACRHGGNVTPSWLYQTCRAGQNFLFLIERDGSILASFVAAFIEDWPGGPVVKIVALGGRNLADWVDELDAWQWPRRFGIERYVFEGRAGLGKVFPRAKQLYATYSIEVKADARH